MIITVGDTQLIINGVGWNCTNITMPESYYAWCLYTPSAAMTPTATSISPSSGNMGNTITIHGTGFGTDPAQLTVLVGTQPGTVYLFVGLIFFQH